MFKNALGSRLTMSGSDWLILIAMIGMFLHTFYKLGMYGWDRANATHAYFILPISLWFIFRNRRYLIRNNEINFIGLSIFILGILLYIFSKKNDFLCLEASVFVVMIWAIFAVKLTKESVKKILFPMVYLLFIIPPPTLAIDTVTLPLKKISTYGSYLVLKVSHLPVDVYGVILNVGGNELFIADACSGYRSLVSFLAFGAVYAYLQKTSLIKKWILFLLVIPISILGNILRISITGYITYFINQEYAEGFFHNFSGILLVVFATLGLIGLTKLICRRQQHAS